MNRPRVAAEISEECVPNIGLRGRRRRVTSGVFCLAITAAVFAGLAIRHAGVAAYFLLAPLTAYTALFFFQAKEKT